MRKFGLIGGLSWHSTADYYRELNKAVNRFYGSNVNPPLYIINLNQKEIHDLQKANNWPKIGEILIKAAKELESIGCEGLAFCANTPHRAYDTVQDSLRTPILHIGDSIGRFWNKMDYKKVALLGTKYTMEGEFIRARLKRLYSVDVLTPDEESRNKIQLLLYEEMSHGVFSDSAQQYFLSLIDELSCKGAEAVVFGCTEFPILLKDIDTALPKVDSKMCHVEDVSKFVVQNME